MWRTLASILASAILLTAPAAAVYASSPVRSEKSADQWTQILTLPPGQTEASTTRPMRSDICAALLAAYPGHTRADCVTYYTLRVVRDGEAKAGLSAPAPSTLPTYYCNVTVEGYAHNLGWGATVTQRFCVWQNVWAYPAPAGTQCNNWWAVWPFSLAVTWCGGGRSGWYADGGENLTISSQFISYGAGQRVSLTANYVPGWSCWNALC